MGAEKGREGGSLGAQASGGEGERWWDSLEEEEEGRRVGKQQAGAPRGQRVGGWSGMGHGTGGRINHGEGCAFLSKLDSERHPV